MGREIRAQAGRTCPPAGPADTHLRQGEAALAVALRLRQVEDLVHVRLPQSAAEGGEEQAGHQEGAAQGGREVIALQLRHGGRAGGRSSGRVPGPALGSPERRARNAGSQAQRCRTRDCGAGTQWMLGERWTEARGSPVPERSVYATHRTVSLSITARSSQSGQKLREGRVWARARELVVPPPPPPGSGKEECLVRSVALQKARSVPSFLTSKLPNCIRLRLSLFSIASEMKC